MAEISTTFVHPTDNKNMDVTLDATMTVDEVVEKLVQHDFVPSHDEGYQLQLKRTDEQIGGDETLKDAGVEDGDSLIVNPITGAG